MTPERWRQIENICHEALELDIERRSAFLDKVCAGDQTLLGEVESMLAAHGRADDFLEQNALELEAEALALEKTRALPVREFSHYRILSRIGAGGMGEVWLARDNNLDRNVALKFLPVQFTSDKDRLQRFVREAKAASALNHPNIITIHEIGEAETDEGKTHFIATEFIEGQTLRQMLANEELSLKKALDIASQAAAALDAAHHAGIIHRDIKPENIMVRPDGLVKVLDFGLAKLDARRSLPEESVDTSAQTQPGVVKTQPGMILGTLRYMSPEQARGRDVDARTDIFSLGVVLYELIAKQPLFAGETSADVIAAIIHKEPAPLTDFAPDVPPELERIVHKALAKEARDRYQTARDLQLDLQMLKDDLGVSAQRARLRSSGSSRFSGELNNELLSSSDWNSRGIWRWSIAGITAVVLLLVASLTWKLFWQPSRSLPRELSFETLFGKKGQDKVLFLESRFSPNGMLVAFASDDERGSNIRVRQIGSDGEQQITFGEWEDSNPIWSPKGEKIAFVSTRGNQLGIWVTTQIGGTLTAIKTLGDAQTLANRGRLRMVAWAKDERAIFYEWQHNLYRLDLMNKETVPLIQSNQPFQMPQDFSLSPDERETVFTARQNGQYDLWRTSLGETSPQRLTNDLATDQHPLWLNDGRLLYNSTRGEKMQVYTVEASGGEPSLISTGDHQCQLTDFSGTTNRILCYELRDDSDILGVDVDSGAERELTDDFGIEFWSSVSPKNGQTLLYQAIPGDKFFGDVRKSAVFTKPVLTTGKATRLVPDAFDAQWSPDGRQVGFLRLAEQIAQLWTVSADGGDPTLLIPQNLFFGGWRSSPPYNRAETRSWDWSPDSKTIAYSSKQNDIYNAWVKTLDRTQPVKISDNMDSKLLLKCPIWSPNGEQLAYVTEPDPIYQSTDKQVWNVWVSRNGQSGKVFQTENRLKLRGWLNNDQLLVAMAENVVGSSSSPTTVTLISMTVPDPATKAVAQHSLGALPETYLSNVHLSPDGGKIAFVKVQNRRHDIWIVSVTGNRLGPPQKVTKNSDPAFRFASLSWSPNGKTLYYDKQTRWSLLVTSSP